MHLGQSLLVLNRDQSGGGISVPPMRRNIRLPSQLRIQQINQLKPGKGTNGYSISRSQLGSPSAASRKRRILSQSFIVNLDPQGKSNQSETAVLHHDIIQNPETAFHFQLHWIGASAKFVDDTIQSWSRTVERYGLRMVEAYVDQVSARRQVSPR